MSRRSIALMMLTIVVASAAVTRAQPDPAPDPAAGTPPVEVLSDRTVFRGFHAEDDMPIGAPRLSPSGRFALFPSLYDGGGPGLDHTVWHVMDREQSREVAHLTDGEWVFLRGGKRIAFWWYDRAGGAGLCVM